MGMMLAIYALAGMTDIANERAQGRPRLGINGLAP